MAQISFIYLKVQQSSNTFAIPEWWSGQQSKEEYRPVFWLCVG